MMIYVWIGLGGALGSIARFLMAEAVVRWMGGLFHGGVANAWGTMAVNVLGCFVIGFFSAVTAPAGRWPVGGAGRMFFMTGFLGGFTTFSTFSLQALELAQSGQWARAGGYAGGTMVLCLLAVWLGYVTAQALNPARTVS